jgi:transposase
VVEKIIDDQRKRRHPLREIVNAVFSINRSGAQWRELDRKHPLWQVAYLMK